MRVVVLGAGVVGVTSAYYLAEAGHEVILIDRQPGPALETSFANAGEISPGYASPWAAPGIPLKAMRWLFMKHAPLILKPRIDMAMLRWIVAMLRNCTSARYALNKSRMVRLAEYSRDQLIALRGQLPLDYDQRSRGTLQLFRTQKQFDDSAGDIAVLEHYGVAYELLGRDACVAAERGLSAAQAQAGALGADQYVAVQQGARVIVEIGEPFHRRDAIGQAQQPVGPGGKADVQPSDPRDARLVKQCLQAAADRPRARGAAYVDLRRLRRHGPDDARQMRDLMRRIVIEQKQDSGWKHPSGTGPASLIERTA